jgi:hypothetical protein
MRRLVAIVAALLLSSRAAFAEGFTGYVEEDYTRTRSTVSDQAGGSTRNDADQFTQRYRLAYDRYLWPLVHLGVGGAFEQVLGTSTVGDASTDLDGRTTNLFGNLALGNQVLGAVGGYNRQEQTAGTTTIPFGFVSEDINALLFWRPDGLPWLTLRLARPTLYDRDHRLQDITTNQALFTATYLPIQQIDLRYALDYQQPTDRVHQTETNTITQSARASYDDRVFNGRSTVSLAVNVVNQRFEVTESSPGGTTTTVLAPIAGFSLVETFPATPAQDTLVPNAQLINGDFTASAGMNIGTSVSLSGDVRDRDLGAQLADAATSVNVIRVWVDKQLPPTVAATLGWAAWTSNDNATWTQAPLTGPVVFDPFQPRFDIPFRLSQARYLKVVTKPLGASATLDPQFRDVFVTEIQLLLVSAAPAPNGPQTTTGATINASARTQLFDTPLLAHDISLFATRGERPGSSAQNTYLLTNGLTFTRRLSEIFVANARVARQDGDQSRGHESEWLYTASMAATPLATLTGSVVYSGKYDTNALGSTSTNSISLFTQATPYRGIGLLLDAGYGVVGLPTGQSSELTSATFSATLQPHQALTLTTTVGHSASVTTGGGLPRSSTVTNRIEGTLTFSPVRALYISAGASRTFTQPRPVTLANANASFAPFPGGDLQLGVGLAETLEGDGSVTQIVSPTVRWKIGRAVASATYTIFSNDSDVAGTHAHTFNANVRIPL